MSNIEAEPAEIECVSCPEEGIEVIEARSVPLGGIRAMKVNRTLPTRDRSMVGAWCFADHYGPEPVSQSGGMQVIPHPHTGLQTVSWLFEGEIEHRDSAGVHAMVLPGEMNLMSAGHGISHSEVSTERVEMLHGLQLWVALPDAVRDDPHGFQHYAPPSVPLTDPAGAAVGSMKVFVGTLGGSTADIVTATPLMGAEVIIEPRASVDLDVDATFEHGVLLDTDALEVNGVAIGRSSLAYVGPGATRLELVNTTDVPARVVVLGGEPFEEDVIMWWNFVGRTHDEIVGYREEWQERAERFGSVDGWGSAEWIPAPPLPNSRLKPRKRPQR
ncbi:pirin family protein [Gordonia sp. (in: high G+C Gram-positive bacteria)]|uniref:pirin family protein n=1 Tax=Gordonia sp. (in: high G+C Gram-positive bacteria) TaxID=84139 RepID=UPI0016B4833D|nr:pirin family protein [Gordonia sp. (in: high G+C Gram-positive bacteria)]NLG46330.1 pirin family protein [Gordonia sp. (in: high G+C Gram-positive bacteria)]